MFSVLNEIFDNSHFRTTAVIAASIGSACFLYVLVGITGYLSYGDNIEGNIVKMCTYSNHSPLTYPRSSSLQIPRPPRPP